jgi:hypothetical protein
MFSSGTRSGRSFPVSEFGIGSELEKFDWVGTETAGDLARSQLAEQDVGCMAMEAGLMAARGIETAGRSGDGPRTERLARTKSRSISLWGLSSRSMALAKWVKDSRFSSSDLVVDAVSPDFVLLWRRASTFCKAPLKKSAGSVKYFV